MFTFTEMNLVASRKGLEAEFGKFHGEGARCMPVHYKLLVKEPEYWRRIVFNFFQILFNSGVLNYREQIGKPWGIQVSR